MLFDLEIGTNYDFPMLAPAILGTSIKGATILGFLDYSSAISIEDVSALHASVLSLLPTGTTADPAKLIYVKLRTSISAVRMIALQWIAYQPTRNTANTLVITVNNVNHSELARVASLMRANGFSDFTIT